MNARADAGGAIFARHPGCNVWLPSPRGGRWGNRCGDINTRMVVHLCPSCAAQVPPEEPGERDALIADWVSLLDPEGWPTQADRDAVASGLLADLPPIAGLRALVGRRR